METSTYAMLLFLPSIGIVYVVLASFYGPRRAYEAISWIPLALLFVLWGFRRLETLTEPLWDLAPFGAALALTSLVQALAGVALLSTALARRQPWLALAAAVVVSAVPYVATPR